MKSKTLIEKQLKRKTNPEVVKTIIASKNSSGWVEISGILSGLSRNKAILNLNYIDSQAKEGEIIVVPGKVLSVGELTKKIKIVALSASKSAIEKINNSGSKFVKMIEEIKSNPEAKGIKILR
jgi:large subunit ribosomal protein L18e